MVNNTDEATGTFIWLTDIHYDPFYGQSASLGSEIGRLHPLDSYMPSKCQQHAECDKSDSTFGMKGCDSPFSLVQACISAAADAVPKPDFVLVSGDFDHHRCNDVYNADNDTAVQSLQNSMSEVVNLLRVEYPKPTPIIPTLGNNDVIPDYGLDVKDAHKVLLNKASETFINLFLPSWSSTFDNDTIEMKSTFREGGYYANKIISPKASQVGLTILVLNTVIYSKNHSPDQTNITDPYQQFQWLDKSLASAKDNNCKVYIMGHIPPTIGSFRHTQFWHEIYIERYSQLIRGYKDVVVAQLFGHLHSDEFRILPGLPPLLIAPAITPIFGNNPSFRIVTFDRRTLTILDYETRFIDLEDNTTAQWQSLPSFRVAYSVPDISITSLRTVERDISTMDDALATFLSRLHVKSKGSVDIMCDKICRTEWKCTLTSFTNLEFERCKESSTSSETGSVVFIVSILLATIFTCLTVLFFYKRSDHTAPMTFEMANVYSDSESDSEESQTIPQIS